LNRIITNWEQSGQGDSGHLPENGEHGNLQNRPATALDCRASFLGDGYPSYLLVLWEIADTHQILQHTLQRLAVGVGSTSARSPPSVIKCPTRPPSTTPMGDQSIASVLNETMDVFAEKMVNAQRENQAFQEKRELENQAYQDKTRIDSQAYQEKTRIESQAYEEKTRIDSQAYQEKTRINSRISQLTDLVRSTKKEKFRSRDEEEKIFLQQEIDSMETEIQSLHSSLREVDRNSHTPVVPP
jgi:cell pole-organizing protein PopZ